MEARVGVIETVPYDKLWLAGCKLAVKNGRVWKAATVGRYYSVLPHETGQCTWHPFQEDLVRWAYGGDIDWQDHTWEFEEGTFTIPAWGASQVNPKLLLEFLAEKCTAYVDVDMANLSFKTRPGWVMVLDKFPHNCGNEFRIKAKE